MYDILGKFIVLIYNTARVGQWMLQGNLNLILLLLIEVFNNFYSSTRVTLSRGRNEYT